MLRPMKLSGGFPRAGNTLLHRDAQSAAGHLRYTSGLADHQPFLLSEVGIIFLTKMPIYFRRKEHSLWGKDFKMICITAATPSSSDHGRDNFSSHAQGFASSSLANSPHTLLDSGTFSPPNPGREDPTGSAPAFPQQPLSSGRSRVGGITLTAPLGSQGCPALSRICPVTLQLTPTSKWLQKKVTKSEA